MKKILTLAMSFMLIVCLSVLATGCTMKVDGKTFAYESLSIEVNTSGLTAEERTTLINELKEDLGLNVNANSTDKELTDAYNANEEVKLQLASMLESVKNETIKMSKNKITYYENGVANGDTGYYKQKDKVITIYEDEALTKLPNAEDSSIIRVDGKKLVMSHEVENGIFIKFVLKQA